MGSSVMSAHFLGKMVRRACINQKEAQIHNNLTLHCGFHMEIEQIDGQLTEEGRFSVSSSSLSIFINRFRVPL
jgi:hypothetical protein